MTTAKIIEVFKTNVQEIQEASALVQMLENNFPGSRVNFDLWDEDRILRVEASQIDPARISALMKARGYCCTLLEE